MNVVPWNELKQELSKGGEDTSLNMRMTTIMKVKGTVVSSTTTTTREEEEEEEEGMYLME